MMIQYIKKVATAVGVAVVLAAGAVQAADSVASDNQRKQSDNTLQAANTGAAVDTSNRATSDAPKVQERVDVSSPSYRKFLDEIGERSGG
jgi:hypothetical protein